jgi:hypothetical protein
MADDNALADPKTRQRDNSIVPVCVRGRERQLIGILDLPLPSPEPAGSEWIEASRRWLGAS